MPFMPGSDNTLEVAVESSGVHGFRNNMGRATEALFSFRAAVGAAGAALGAMAAGGLALATREAAKFEDAMVEVEKVAGAAAARKLDDEIRDMATNIPLAQEELAALTADAARFGIEGTENIRNFTEVTAKMATATNLATQEAGQALAKLAELTNTPVSEVENLGSSINALSNNFATSAQEVVDSMLRSSAALSTFGLNQRQIAGIGAALNEVSASARRAGTRLRRVAQELMDPKKVKEVSSALGISVDEFQRMRDEEPAQLFLELAEAMRQDGEAAEKIRQSLSTVSRQALAGLGQNLEGTREALELSNDSFERATSLQEEFSAATDTFNAKLTLLRNRLRNLGIEIGNVVLPAATRLIEKINAYLDSGDSLLNQLSAEEKAWGLVATAIGGVSLAVASFISGPLGVLTAAVGSVAAAYASNFMGIRDTTESALEDARGAFDEYFAVVGPTVRSELSEIQSIWSKHGGDIQSDVNSAYQAISSAISKVLNFVQNNLIMPWASRLNRIIDRHLADLVREFVETWNVVAANIRQFTNGVIIPLWNRFGDEIVAVAKFFLDTLMSTIGFALDALLTTIRATLAVIRGDWGEAWDLMAGLFERTFDGIVRFATKWDRAFKSAVRDAVIALGRWLISNADQHIATPIENAFNDAVTGAKRKLRNFISDIKTDARSLGRQVGQRIKSAINSALGLPFQHTIGSVQLGGKQIFGGKTLRIPALAEGGIVTEPTLAMIGENGPERVEPLDESSGGVNIGRLVINASSREAGRRAAEGFNRELRSMNISDTGATR